jgi:transposase
MLDQSLSLPAFSTTALTKAPQGEAEVKHLRGAFVAALAENRRLRVQLEETQEILAFLNAEYERLEAELKELKQAPFKPRKSRKGAAGEDTPPAQPKKRGRPVGHKGSGRSRPKKVDISEFVSVGEHCPDCQAAFSGKGVERTRIVEDIEPVRPTIVTRYVIERRWCPECKAYKESPVTAALPRHRLGLQVMLFVVYQKTALGLSYGKVKKELKSYFGLEVSRGTLVNIITEVSQMFGPAYAQLIRLMRQQAAIHIDETTWPVDGKRHWLWIFINEMVALYVVSRSRGSKVPKALLGDDFEGVVISDFFSAYSPLDAEKAKCWTHLLRDSHALTKGDPAEERLQFHHQLHTLFLEMGLALEEAAADENQREQVYQDMRTKLLDLAQHPWTDPDCQRLAQRILKYLEDLLLWLRNPDVAPDNNQAERGLRPAVVTRKTSFGSRSKQGAHAFACLLSLIQTWENQGLDFFEMARATFNPD